MVLYTTLSPQGMRTDGKVQYLASQFNQQFMLEIEEDRYIRKLEEIQLYLEMTYMSL